MEDKIAEVFRKHFFHYGFKKTNVDEVAAELKISKKTIYQYFKSKDDIMNYVIKQLAHAKVDEIRVEIAQYPTHTDQLMHLIDLAINKRRAKMKEFGHRFIDVHEREMVMKIFSDAFHKLFSQIIEAGVLTNEFEVDDLELTLKYVQGIMIQSIETLDQDIDAPVEQNAKRAVFKLLKPTEKNI